MSSAWHLFSNIKYNSYFSHNMHTTYTHTHAKATDKTIKWIQKQNKKTDGHNTAKQPRTWRKRWLFLKSQHLTKMLKWGFLKWLKRIHVLCVASAGLANIGNSDLYSLDRDNTWKTFYITTRDSNMENAKTLAELVDNKLATHYDLDDSGKKKVRHPLSRECWQNKQDLIPGSEWEPENTVLFSTDSSTQGIM